MPQVKTALGNAALAGAQAPQLCVQLLAELRPLLQPQPGGLGPVLQLALDLGEPVAAVAGPFQGQPPLLVAQIREGGLEPLQLVLLRGLTGLQVRDLRLEQPGLALGEEVAQGVSLSGQILYLGAE